MRLILIGATPLAGFIAYYGVVAISWIFSPPVNGWSGLGYLGWAGIVGMAAAIISGVSTLTAPSIIAAINRTLTVICIIGLLNLAFVWCLHSFGGGMHSSWAP